MAKLIPLTPRLPRALVGNPTPQALAQYDAALNTALFHMLVEIAARLNLALPHDGSEAMTGPLVLPSYEVSALPAAAPYTGGLVFVTDETGGAVPAFSDGTNWRRVTDRNTVSA